MVWLKFYQVEESYNKDLYAMKISAHQAQLLANKLSRHFKFRRITVSANGRTRGLAYSYGIQIPKVTSVGLVIHECAHVHNYAKYGNFKHNKKLHTTIKRFSSYFHKHLKEQFGTLKVSQPKAKPSPLEKYELKLRRTQQSVKRLTTKIKTLKTRLKTAKKRQTYCTKRIRQIRRILAK